jgi:lysophospholipase L1-like esterase
MSSTSSLPPYRVFAFGDSLTAGTLGYELHPYAPYLETAINSRGGINGRQVIVRHRGLPGWTAKEMLNNLDDGRAGLRAAIRNIQNPSLSLVIILAGTNDMGFGFGEHEIMENILKLHQVCYDEGVPRTIAVEIPPSGYQSVNADAARVATSINSNLKKFCHDNKERATYHTFPFPFEKDGENWDADTLHFSRKGYQTLGESLVDVVMESLNAT